VSVYPADTEIRRAAHLSDCGQYRYVLHRMWGDGLPLTFAMLNPSTADAEQDDPTISRCVGFARREGYDGIRVVNLYAFRATKPADLWRAAEPTGGERNDDLLREIGRQAKGAWPLVAAWGAQPRARGRIAQVLAMPGWDRVIALGVTKDGSPRHPLYVPADAPLMSFREPMTTTPAHDPAEVPAEVPGTAGGAL
jgi:hypothetical protein